ncbi:MAG: hypothetical protein HFJ41_06000 [Clostridia bacterium]|nr:hypothetical protein [Clostridia bacterium]
MMPLINFTEPLAILTALALFVLVLFLGRETKKSIFLAIMLGIFLLIIAGHTIEFSIVDQIEIQNIYARCITIDFVFILLSFMSYLWIDDIEAKSGKKKSIDDSLNWFWSKV